jgi:hypothetical protein
MVLFALVTIGGMIFIWSAKLSGWSTGVVTAVPLVLMAIYFLASLMFSGFRLQNEQAGDNLYYMGFLFTLSSLGVSLYLFVGETSIETIVQNFGIAVTSTIAGVTLRILFNQMRRDPMDIERSVRHELAEMTRRVRTELDNSSREFSNFRRVSNQMLAEGFEEIARQAEKNGEEIRKAMEAISRDAIAPMQEAAGRLTAIIEDHNRSVTDQAAEATRKLTETTDRLSAIIDRFGGTVEAVGQRIEDIKPPEDAGRAELARAVEAIRQMTETHVKRLDEARATPAPAGAPDSLERKLDRIAEALERGALAAARPAAPDAAAAPVDPVPASAISSPEAGASSNREAPEPEPEPRRRWFKWTSRQAGARS